MARPLWFYSLRKNEATHAAIITAAIADLRTAGHAANVIEARFRQSGAQALRTAIATGNVTIVTPNETVRANRAEYDFTRRRATATGNVRLARGQNVLTGGKAVIDFKTGISRMSGSAKASDGGRDDGRVRGLIFPPAVKP